MHKSEKQVRQLLTNANQSLNFLRTVIDDLIYLKEELLPASLEKLYKAQENYKIHKAVLTNIEELLSNEQYPIPEALSNFIIRNLLKRISNIIETSIELDKER